MKFLAALIILCGSWCIGQSQNIRRAARIRSLRRTIDGLDAVEGEIRGRLAPLPEALAAGGRLSPFFAAAAVYIEETDAKEALSRAAAETMDEDAETEILKSLGEGLFSEAEASLLHSLSYARARLLSLTEMLENDGKRLEKLYSGSGAAIGLLVVVILF